MRNLVRYRRHSRHRWTCRWVAPVANDPEQTCIMGSSSRRFGAVRAKIEVLMAELAPDPCPIAPIHRPPDESRNSGILRGRVVNQAGRRDLQSPATRIAPSEYGR